MPTYLDVYKSAIGAGQLEAVQIILNEMQEQGLIRSVAEQRVVLEGLIEALTGRQFQPQYAELGVVRSRLLNDNFERMFVVLRGLYTHIDRLSNTIRSHQTAMSDLRQTVKKAIHRLSQDVRQFLFLRNNPDYSEVKQIDFADTRNLYTGRNPASVDQASRSARLTPIRQLRLNEIRGIRETKITTEILTPGVESLTSRTFEPLNALDQDDKSFWTELVMVENPLTTIYEGTSYSGLVVKATVKFAGPEWFSNLQVLPYGSFPVKILDIRYKSQFDTVSTQWPGWSDQGATFDWLDYTGQRIVAEEVEIVFLQESFTRASYLIPEWARYNTLVWERVLDDDLDTRYLDQQISGIEARDALTNPSHGALIEATRELERNIIERDDDQSIVDKRVRRIVEASIDILGKSDTPILRTLPANQVTDGEDTLNNMTEIDKLEYAVGAFTIRIADVEYARSGVYRGPKFAIQHNPVSMDLTSVETRPQSDSKTSVEYDILLSDNRSTPILPVGLSQTVTHELLAVDPNTLKARTRFVPTSVTSVYQNGTPFNTSAGVPCYIVSGSTVTMTSFNRNAVYTITYVASVADETIDIEDAFDSTESVEVFVNTDQSNSVQLKYYPHIVYDVVNDTQRWIRPDSRQGIWRLDLIDEALTYDGFSYGVAEDALDGAITAADTSLTLADASDYPTVGVLLIGAERIKYQSKVGNILSGLIRGWSGTVASVHADTDAVSLVTKQNYEPLIILVNGQRANNITDYYSREHPAFANRSTEGAVYEYVQSGRRIYFNKSVASGQVEVQYRYMVEYVQLQATLRNHQLGTRSLTPVIDRYAVRMKTDIA